MPLPLVICHSVKAHVGNGKNIKIEERDGTSSLNLIPQHPTLTLLSSVTNVQSKLYTQKADSIVNL